MINKIFLSMFLGISVIFNGIISPIEKTQKGDFEYNSTTDYISAQNEKCIASPLNKSNILKIGVTDDDRRLCNVNMVNYNMQSKKISYEKFDMQSYEKRTKTQSTNLTSQNEYQQNNDLDTSIDGIDLEAHKLKVGNNEFIYSNGYNPTSSKDFSEQNSDSRIIIGDDDREKINETKSFPYSAVAYIEATFNNVYSNEYKEYKSRTFTGTAFMQGDNLAVTAGHCVYADVTDEGQYQDNIDNPRFPDEIKLYFGINGESELNSNYAYYAEALVVNIEYSYYVSPNFNRDWAAIELDRDIGKQTGYLGRITNYPLVDVNVTSFGYPLDKDNATMWSTTGSITGLDDYRIYTDIDSYGGQSGSPYYIFVDYLNHNYVCGVNTFGNSSENQNGGTRMDFFMFNYLESFSKSKHEDHIYDYLDMKISLKSGSVWYIKIKNKNPMGLDVEYNTKMCFKNDAIGWENLKDINTLYLGPYSEMIVTIQENFWATSIVSSFMENDKRVVSMAYDLDVNKDLVVHGYLITYD